MGDRFDLGNAPLALDLPRHRLAEELSKRGLKASGFPLDDARRLQVFLDKEWEATKAERMQEAREAYQKKRQLEAVMASKAHEELQLREEAEAIAGDATAAFYLRLIREQATPASLCLRALTPPAMRACVKALGGNTSLLALDLTGCHLDDDSIGRALAGMLASNRHLLRLDLDMNSLTSGGAACLATGLQGNSTLASLSLEGNPLCKRGGEIGRGGAALAAVAAAQAAAAAAAAGSGASVSAAAGEDASASPQPALGEPDHSGFAALALALTTHPALRSLNVFGCGLGREGGSALARALPLCPTLCALQLSPADGCWDSDLAACRAAVAANSRGRAEAEAARLAGVVEAVRGEEAAAQAAAVAAGAEAVVEWGAREAERRAGARREAEEARVRQEQLERVKRAAEYKEYLAAKAAAEAEKAAKEASKKK
jgi:hypothetical protein